MPIIATKTTLILFFVHKLIEIRTEKMFYICVITSLFQFHGVGYNLSRNILLFGAFSNYTVAREELGRSAISSALVR